MPRLRRPRHPASPPVRSPAPRSRSVRGAAVLACGVALTAACTPVVSVAAAPHATDPVCAEVVLALPAELATFQQLRTSSQATAAWGDPAAPIVLRCGVEPPGPTTEACVTATDDTGTSVDWIAVQGAPGPGAGATWTFTSYGRTPAVEVTVPAAITRTSSTSFLVDLGPAVSRISQVRTCV